MSRLAVQLPRLAGVLALLVAVLAGFVATPTATAAAEGVVRSEPAQGSVVGTAPTSLVIEFEGSVSANRTELRVVPPGGGDLVAGELTVDGNVVTVPLSTATTDGLHRALYSTQLSVGGDVRNVNGSLTWTLRSGGCDVRVKDTGGFTSVLAPGFASAPDTIVEATVDPTFEDLLYATNGRELHRSLDGGCTWQVVLDLATEAGPLGMPGTAYIGGLATSRENPGLLAILALDPLEQSTGLAQPSVYVLPGAQGEAIGGGPSLPPVRLDPTLVPSCRDAQPCRLAISDAIPPGGAPSIFFLAKPDPDVGAAQLHISEDLGTTFRAGGGPLLDTMADPAEAAVQPPLSDTVDLATDAANPFAVYVAVGSTIHLSSDGGDSFTAAHRVTSGQITHLVQGTGEDADERPYKHLVAATADEPGDDATALLTFAVADGALTERPPIDLAPIGSARLESVTAGLQPGQLLVLPAHDRPELPGIFEYERAADELRDVDTFDVSPWRGGAATNPLCSRWFGHDDTHLFLVDGDDGHLHVHDNGQFCQPPDPEGSAHSVAVVPFPPAQPAPTEGTVLSPGTTTIVLEPGTVQAIGYRLQRAAENTPVDVAFLFDTSGSMRDNIDQVRAAFEDVVNDLNESGIDAWFGLAEFNDLAQRYRRLADIRPPDSEFSRALARVQATGGQREPHYTALHELATGEGIASPSNGAAVEPGGQMNFRPDSVRIVIMASDEPVTDDPEGASFTDAVSALAGRDIVHIGLHVQPEPDDIDNDDPTGQRLLEEMRVLSSATGGFAVAPVDCNGDGTPELQPGDPLVCSMNNDPAGAATGAASTAVATAIGDLVEAVQEERPFRLVPESSIFEVGVDAAGLDGVGSYYPAIDVKRPQNLVFTVRFSCTRAEAGRSEDVALRALLGELVIGEATATVQCGSLAATTAATQPSQPTNVALLPPPAPAPPSVPIQANAPASAQSAAQSFAASTSTTPVGAAAVAPQAQAQAQSAEIGRDDDDDYLATPVRHRSTDIPTPVAAGMLVASAAGFVELRRRRSVGQAAAVRVRRG